MYNIPANITDNRPGENRMAQYLVRRGGFWRFVRRVPMEYLKLDNRGIVQRSTGIRIVDDPRAVRAREVVAQYNAELERYWRDLSESDSVDAQALRNHKAAMNAARKLNLSPPINDAAQRTIAELLDRIEKLTAQLPENLTPENRAAKAASMAVYDAAPKPPLTFKQCATRYIESQKAGWKNGKHAKQWSATLATYAYPIIGDVKVDRMTNSVGTDLIMKVIDPIWQTKTETANRVRGRIEAVLDWAKAHGYRDGENPARWRGHLEKLLPKRSKVAPVKHFPAMPYADVPDFMKKLREQKGTAARALEFAILTAARTSEVTGARRSEIDLKDRVWTVPAERMKGGRVHRVPLSDWAIKIVKAMPADSEFLFPGSKPGKPLSNMALLMTLGRMGVRDDAVTHGFRSTFRDWGAETGDYPNELLEMAMAHAVGDKVEAAYRRSDLLKKRHKLMSDWEVFCNSSRK